MASDYGLNFGFRRSDESLSVRESRFKTPAEGTALLLGSAVEIDPANPGRLKQSADNAEAVTGLCGLLVQEENHIPGLFDVPGHDSLDLGRAKLDKLAIIWSGQGTKVWFRNTGEYSRGGRSKAAVEMVSETGLAVGDALGWDGSKWVEVDGTDVTNAWLSVTAVSTDYVEAVVRF